MNPLKTFIIYARSDEDYKKQLLLHLRPLVSRRAIEVWHDGNILPGEQWEKAIMRELKSSDLVLVLVSANSLNSEFILTKELQTALERLSAGLARVVPIVVSPCAWQLDPILSDLQALPLFGKEGVKPVRSWPDPDEAWATVVGRLGEMIAELREKRAEEERLSQQEIEEKRQLELQEKREKEERERREREETQRERLEREEVERQRRERETRAASEAETRRQQEAEAARLREEQRLREETERLRREEDARRLREAEEKRERERAAAHAAAWQEATQANNLGAYDNYLFLYPDGEHAREARYRIKEIHKENKKPFPVHTVAYVGMGVASLLFIWFLLKSIGGSEATTLSAHLAKFKKSGLEMVAVQGGAYTMGQPDPNIGCAGCSANECLHPVTVGDFKIGKYEVTQADWREVMGNNPSNFKGCDECPVEQVSWDDVQGFLKKVNAKYGTNFRLLTEEEWEYAARGGQHSLPIGEGRGGAGFKYAGSDNLDAVAWYSDNSGAKTHPVGGKSPNQLGLYDMSGNVLEWCQDTSRPYPCDSKTTPDNSLRVVRGGSWNGSPDFCRVAYRDRGNSGLQYGLIGFRLAR